MEESRVKGIWGVVLPVTHLRNQCDGDCPDPGTQTAFSIASGGVHSDIRAPQIPGT